MHTFIPPVGVTQTQGDARYARRVSTVAALRNLSGADLAGAAATEGYYAAGDARPTAFTHSIPSMHELITV